MPRSGAEGRATPKALVIGEAGSGHSFLSEAVGPISIMNKGKAIPLLARTIFAKKIHENILSVSEAVDKGYMMVFGPDGVKMLQAKDVVLKGIPILSGGRDKKSRLFYFNFAPETSVKASVATAASDVEPKGIPSTLEGIPSTLEGLPSTLPANKKGISPLQLLPVVGNSSLVGGKWFDASRERRAKDKDASGPESWERVCDAIANLSQTYHELKTDFDVWHSRLAHINPRLALIAKPDLRDWPKKCHCDSCTKGKFHKHPHSGSRPAAKDLPWAPGEYVTCDLFGPLLRSMGGARYVAFYTDLKSRFLYVKALRYKSDNYQAMTEVFQDIKARSGNAMRFFKSDGDGIFIGEEAMAIYARFSIRHMQSAPGDSASNDIAERTIRTMAELTCTNLLHAGAPTNLWAEAMCLVAYVWNYIAVCPNPLLPGGYLSRTAILEGHGRKFNLRSGQNATGC